MTLPMISDCPGCGAPAGYPPGGPCINHGTPEAVATNDAVPVCKVCMDVGRPCSCDPDPQIQRLAMWLAFFDSPRAKTIQSRWWMLTQGSRRTFHEKAREALAYAAS